MSKPRHKRKAPCDGDLVIVGSWTPAGEAYEYDAIFHVVSADGKSVLEKVRARHVSRLVEALLLFRADRDVRIVGFLGWFKISNHYVLISRHTEKRTHARIKQALVPTGAGSWL